MKRNSIFFDHEQRKRDLRRISMVGPKINFTPKKKETIRIPNEIINEISKKKVKKIKDIRDNELRIIKNSLEKHSQNTKEIYNKQVIQNILNKNTCQHGRFKEMLLMIDNAEFLTKFYGYYKSKDKIILFGLIFNSYQKIYPSYLGMGILIYNFMTHYLLVKQRLIDRINNKGKINNKRTSQTNSFSLTFFLDHSRYDNYNKSNNSYSLDNISGNKEQESVKDISIKEITKLVYKIISTEENIKKEKEKEKNLKIKSILKESYNLSEIPILFKSPLPLRNKNNNFNYPKIKSNSQSAGRIKKSILNSYIKHYQEKNLDNLNIKVSISKDDKKRISALFLSKSKRDFDLNKLKNNPDLFINEKHYIPKSQTERRNLFKTTKDFLKHSKKNNINDLEKVINNLIKDPSVFFESIGDYKNKNNNKNKTNHKRNLTSELNNNKTQTTFFLRTYSKKKKTKHLLKSDCMTINVQTSPKIINKKVKKKVDILNLKQSRNKHLNISSNYYYNSFFNSDDNRTIEKQFLKIENNDLLSSSKNNCPVILSSINNNKNSSDKSIFKKRIMNKNKNNIHFKRNYSSYNYKTKKKNIEHKEKYDNIYLRNISN